jgi:hypothetical protein
MANLELDDDPIVISEDDARGAEGPKDGSVGDTLMPMLAWGLGLTTIGVAAVFVFMM